MSVLSEILATKKTEVAHRKALQGVHFLQEKLIDAPPVRSFRAALASGSRPGLIAEVKHASPSKGIIRQNFDHVAIASAYQAAGANCLSVLTDERYFKGSLQFLCDIRSAVELPLLRKDFMIDPWQILESRANGADAILLIVAALTPDCLREMLATSAEYGMTALVEVHHEEEMREALEAGATTIGINNRDLHTFNTNLKVTLDLLPTMRNTPGTIVVSESGISTPADVAKLRQAGVDAVLVGEAFMREDDVAEAVRHLMAVPATV
jgi:indole-3-glycerol phosphate synthase